MIFEKKKKTKNCININEKKKPTSFRELIFFFIKNEKEVQNIRNKHRINLRSNYAFIEEKCNNFRLKFVLSVKPNCCKNELLSNQIFRTNMQTRKTPSSSG